MVHSKSYMLIHHTWGNAKPRAQMTGQKFGGEPAWAGGDEAPLKGRAGIPTRRGLWRVERTSLGTEGQDILRTETA